MDYKETVGDIIVSIIESSIGEKGKNAIEKIKKEKSLEKMFLNLDTYLTNIEDERKKEIIQKTFINYSKSYVSDSQPNSIRLEVQQIVNDLEKDGVIVTPNIEENLIDGITSVMKFIYDLLPVEERMLFNQGNRIYNKLNEYTERLGRIEEKITSEDDSHQVIIKRDEKNDFTHFKDMWNEDLFLNNTESDKKMSLSQVFIKTNFTLVTYYRNRLVINNYDKSYKVNEVLIHYDKYIKNENTLDEFIDSFMSSSNKILIVLGQPGSGKSSFIAYLAGNKFKDKRNCIFIKLYKINDITDENDNFLEQILIYLNMEECDLENKILVLDGFDELILYGDRNVVIANFINNVKNKYKRLKIIVTMRENYIDIENSSYISYYEECKIIILDIFNLLQIAQFHLSYLGERITEQRLEVFDTDLNALGIPIILYIIYALNLDINNVSDKYKLYERIFSTKNGIYDKCNKYDDIGREFSVEEKEMFHEVSQKIAFLIFKSVSKHSILISDIEKELEKYDYSEVILRHYMTMNYYEKTDNDLMFKHKSFYDYFLAIYIQNLLVEEHTDNHFAEILCNTLCYGDITEAVPYLEHKIESIELPQSFYEHLYNAAKSILIYGGIYYLDNMSDNGLCLEANIFLNVMTIIRITSMGTDKRFHCCSLRDSVINELTNLKQIYRAVPKDLFTYVLLTDETDDMKLYNLDEDSFSCNNALINIEGKPIFRKNINHSVFCQSSMEKIFLRYCKITNVYFTLSEIDHCRFENTEFENVDFSSCNINNTSFAGSTLNCVNFSRAILKDVTLARVKFENVTFGGCTFEKLFIDKDNYEFLKTQDVNILSVEVR